MTQQIAVLSWKTHGEHCRQLYRDGYRAAANALVQALDKKSQSSIIFPIMFLYRHYSEVELKDLIALGCLTTICPISKIPADHQLRPLAKRVLLYSAAVQDRDAKAETEIAINCAVAHFEETDRHGYGFRYPTKRDGKAIWDDSFTVDAAQIKLDIDRMHGVCSRLRDDLRGLVLDDNLRDATLLY